MAIRGDREADVWLSDEQLSKLTRADEANLFHSPIPTMIRASFSAASRSCNNAPLPVFTSNRIAPAPPASFFDMMLAAMRGIASTVPVTSRSA